MNIYEACKLAGEGGKIAQRSDLTNDNFYLVTDRHSGISMFADSQRISGMWNPQYRDHVFQQEAGRHGGQNPLLVSGH